MYTLKSIVRRGTPLVAVFAMVAATVLPSASVFADALNPLTERSLLLSSSAPGWQDTDGSGNSETNPNAYDPDGDGPTPAGEYYAPPGSGPNGKKSGETFTFRVSTDSAADAANKTIKAFTLQYCTTAAGNCQAPGNNEGDARDDDPSARETNAVAHAKATPTSDFDVVTDGTTPWTQGTGPGTYQVLINGTPSLATWTMSTKNAEDTEHSGNLTGKNNLIMLSSSAGDAPAFNDKIEIKFTPDTKNYITNPGDDAFFVKINTYKTEAGVNGANLMPTTDANIIDGGVTVANVMTDSIHITTKVLETMAFSVGTHNRDTDNLVNPARHGTCDAIQVVDNNRLNLGNPDAESSLETGRAWDVYSYFRLSSNSSGGATVYYSGDTLRNTVGDFIEPVGTTAALSNPGTEQFGLGFVDDSEMVSEVHSTFATEVTNDPDNYRNPSTAPLVKGAAYDGASGNIWAGPDSENPLPIDAEFAFDSNSLTTPAVIAENNDSVLSCSTAKMRYVGNIAADTPAGVYTTKINYLAAPQY